MKTQTFGFGLALLACLPVPALAQRPGPPGPAFTAGSAPPLAIGDVVIHPMVAVDFSCVEHAWHDGGPVVLGDAIGVDCTVVRYDPQQAGRRPPRHYENDGRRNEDWFGWRQELLAPFDGVVDEIRLNAVVNEPGTPGTPPAGFIVFLRADGTRVVYGHIQDPKVAQGDTVRAGQPVALVGNNGFGYMPHTHLGAWRNGVPLQIRFDLRAMGRLQEARMR